MQLSDRIASDIEKNVPRVVFGRFKWRGPVTAGLQTGDIIVLGGLKKGRVPVRCSQHVRENFPTGKLSRSKVNVDRALTKGRKRTVWTAGTRYATRDRACSPP